MCFKTGDEWSSIERVKQTMFAERDLFCHDLNMIRYKYGAHTKHRLMIHLVWIPKYRKRILKGLLAGRIHELLLLCAATNGWEVLELNVQEDHIHIVVQFVPTISVSKMVQLFKGKTSRIIRSEFPELEEVYWGDSFWADGYFAETAGTCNIQTILDYVKNQ